MRTFPIGDMESDAPVKLMDAGGRAFYVRNGQPYYEGASRTSNELASWNARDVSADMALLNEQPMLRARTQDLIRNNGIMSGAVQVHLDNVIGAGLRCVVKPDWMALGVAKPGDEHAEFERLVQARWRLWADDIDHYCDASRLTNFGGIMATMYRSYLSSFEALATAEWLPGRSAYAYSTAIQVVDPQRLCNPQGSMDSDVMRSGVATSPDTGEPLGYYIRSRGYADGYVSGYKPETWTYVPRETAWGRKMVIHVYDTTNRPGQSRGVSGWASVLAKSKMLEKYEQVALQAAIINAMYAAVIESEMDTAQVGQALGASKGGGLKGYVNDKAEFHQGGGIRFNGAKIPHLYPGEKLNLLSPQHPTVAFEAFEKAVLRHIAAGLNLTYEQMSRDYSQTNYSSGRAAMVESWKFFSSRMAFVAAPIATNIYTLWLEEAIQRGDVKLPAGLPDFYEMKSAWTGVKWIGPSKGSMDPEKDANAAKIEYGGLLTTLEDECAKRGLDWEQVAQQRAQEKATLEALGINADEIMQAALGAKPTPPAPEPIQENGNGKRQGQDSAAAAGA